jgi:hypothetical protein
MAVKTIDEAYLRKISGQFDLDIIFRLDLSQHSTTSLIRFILSRLFRVLDQICLLFLM